MANYSKISLKDGKLLLEGTEGNSPWQSAYNINKSFGLSGVEQVNGGVLAYGNRGSDGLRTEKFYSNFNLNDSNSINNLLAQNFNYQSPVKSPTSTGNTNQSGLVNQQSGQSNSSNQTVSTPNVIDSTQGNKFAQNAANEITRLEQQLIDYDKMSKDNLERNVADIERDYARRESEARESFKEQEGTAGVVQFRLGQSGTPYQAAEKAKAAKAKLDFFNNLTAEKTSQISSLKAAYAANDFEAVNNIRGNIYNLQQQQEKFLQEERAAQLQAAQDAIKAAREETEYQQKQEDRYIKNLIPSIYSNLTGDSTTDLQTINDFSEQYGIDKNMLMGNLISYKSTFEKEQLLNSSTVANILSKTSYGGTVNIPGLGEAEILGTNNESKAPTTLKAGGKIYNWAGGKWSDTGISDSDFTPSNIISALTQLDDTDALARYLQGQGIQTAVGSGMRTDRHNNPTAMTTDVARNGGLVEGVDYVQGDPFTTESGQTLYTAKLLGDPIETTIKAIDNMSFTTGSGNNRWNYTDKIPGANNREWPNLSREQKAEVIKQMYKFEGGDGSIFGGGNKFDTFTQEQIALSVMPVQTRNSEMELKRALEGIREGLKQGKDPYEIADNLMGYKVDNPDEFSNTIRGFISQVEGLGGNSPAEFARMINAGNKTGVVNKLETAILKGTNGKELESMATYSTQYGDKAEQLINNTIKSLGLVSGNWNKIAKKVRKDEDFQALSSAIVGLVSEWRHEMIGANATENELKMINDIIPAVTDNPWNALKKIEEFKYMNLTRMNSLRESYNLPTLNRDTLLNREKRAELYGGKQTSLSVDWNGKTYTFDNEEAINKFKSQFNIK